MFRKGGEQLTETGAPAYVPNLTRCWVPLQSNRAGNQTLKIAHFRQRGNRGEFPGKEAIPGKRRPAGQPCPVG